MPGKDFDKIQEDYQFFLLHSTEAQADVAFYFQQLKVLASKLSPLRILDFGCGNGDLLKALLEKANLNPGHLQLHLVEIAREARHAAVRKLQPYSVHPIRHAARLADDLQDVDLIIANHVLYYLDDLQEIIGKLHHILSPDGRLMIAMSGLENFLVSIWQTAFSSIQMSIPYRVAEDVEATFQELKMLYSKHEIHYEIRFPDSTESRLQILYFLLADFLSEMNSEYLLTLFDPYLKGGHIEIKTGHLMYIIV
jgi:SAM-dependent methyltransferase